MEHVVNKLLYKNTILLPLHFIALYYNQHILYQTFFYRIAEDVNKYSLWQVPDAKLE
jgi:hypothetical protein